jgi:hypothetical protein
MQPDLIIPDIVPLQASSSALVLRAKSTPVVSAETYTAAGEVLRSIAGLRKAIVAAFEEPKKKAFDAHRSISKLESDLLAGPAEAERILKRSMGDFQIADGRRRREEELRLQAEDKKRQEDALLAEAERFENAGEHDAAEQLVSTPVVAPVIKIDAPRAEGISGRRKFTFRILDASKLDRKFLIPNETAIRQLVNSLGLDAVSVLGEGSVEILEDRIVSVRA